MMVKLWSTLILKFTILIFAIADETCAAPTGNSEDEIINDLVKWIKSGDGFINSALDVRHVDPDDPSSILGVFATKRIENNEKLISIPWHLMIQPDESQRGSSVMECGTVHSVIREIGLGDKSEFAPYARYIKTRPKGVVPDVWSREGRKVFGQVLGTDLPPGFDVFSHKRWLRQWHRNCGGGYSELEVHAAMVVLTYSEDELMIPYFDIFNHRNGMYLNTRAENLEGNRFVVTAKRGISPGEQIYTSLNMCNLCDGREDSYHTPDILLDYGFVEELPQRWAFGPAVFQFGDLNESGKMSLTWLRYPSKAYIPSLQTERDRLENITLEKKSSSLMPDYEWDVIRKYRNAALLALSAAVRALEQMPQDEDPDAEKEIFISCTDYMEFPGYVDDIGDEKSIYQEISFSENKEKDDVCMFLDNTLQICQSYRPHYHDLFVHFSSAYMKDLKRVVFVGGGDSMLLHEVLKYPNVELVLALELDQKVVRHCFKRFYTQPHFDDERVQWWFGDAAKSINMLPKEMFGSFDLVLVDLSETVMSFTVNQHLDIMGALSLFLKPDGIFVKNEKYMRQLNKIFDHTVELYLPNNPFICDQDWVMGSNKATFLEPHLDVMETNNVQAYLYEQEKHFEAVKDYSKNEKPPQQIRCEEIEALEDILDESPRGFLTVVEAEDVTAKLKPFASLEEELLKVLKNEGFTPLSTHSHKSYQDGDILVIVMREGFVNVHTWPKLNYCAFDIQLWGAFDKLERTRSAILGVVGSKKGSWSSFRVIVGGMLDTNTFSEDRKLIGPDMKRACVKSTEKDMSAYAMIDDTTLEIVMEETLNLVKQKDAAIVVICGDHTKYTCNSLAMVKNDKSFVKVVALWACPADESNVPDLEKNSDVTHIMLCGKDVVTALRETVKVNNEIGAFVIEASVSTDLIKESYGIYTATFNVWTHEIEKGDMVKPNVIFIVLSLDQTRRTFLSMGAEKLLIEPVSWGEVILSDSEKTMDIGVLSSGDPTYVGHLIDTIHTIQRRSGVHTELIKIRGNPTTHQYDFKPKFFRADQFEPLPGQEQYANQQALASQSIFKLEKKFSEEITTARLENALSIVLDKLTGTVLEVESFDDVGKGALVLAILQEGHVIVVWDGDSHVDFNIFIYFEHIDHETHIVNPFVEEMGEMDIVLRDEFPRGIGKVVNFLKDVDDIIDDEEDSDDE